MTLPVGRKSKRAEALQSCAYIDIQQEDDDVTYKADFRKAEVHQSVSRIIWVGATLSPPIPFH